MNSRPSGLSKHDLGMLVVALIWGANFSANKYALGAMPPLAFAAGRFLLATALLWIIVWLQAGSKPVPRRSAWLLAGLGVLGNTGYQSAFMAGLVTTSAINASLIMAALPIAVAVLASVSGVERPSGRLWVGILVATAGVALVIGARGFSFSAGTLRGDSLVLLACLCWAAFTVGIRRVGAGLDPLRVTAITTAAGTPGLVLAAGPGLGAVPWTALSGGVWFAFLFSAVFAIVVSYLLWSHAVQGIGGSRVALYNCVIPVFAVVVAWLVLGERPVVTQFFGAALVFAGVFLSQTGAAPPVLET